MHPRTVRTPPPLPTLGDLDGVDWAALDACYDSAKHIPGWLRELYQIERTGAGDPDALMEQLLGCMIHQNDVYEATVAAIPFLLQAILDLQAPRIELLGTVTAFADRRGDGSHEAQQVRAVIAAEVPHLRPLLADPDPVVRQWTVRLLAAVGDCSRDAVVGWLVEVLATDPHEQVRADAYSVLSVLDGGAALIEREAPALSSGSAWLRLAAALVAAERTGPPFADRVADVLAGDGLLAWGGDGLLHAGMDSDGDRLQTLLTADVDAGLTACRRWLALGHGEAARQLATDLARRWRDREDEVVPVLVEVLPGLAGRRLRSTLGTIAWMMPRVADPSAACEAMSEYLSSPDGPIAAAAGLAVAHGGDPRVLTVPAAITPMALAALAEHDEALPWIVAALRSNEQVADMCAVLPDHSVLKLLPDLKQLLRQNTATSAIASLVIRVHASVTDPEIHELLAAAAATDSPPPAVAVAYALISGDVGPALLTLSQKLTSDQFYWYLLLAGALGPAAAPLLPLVESRLRWEPHRHSTQPGEINVDAAIARWRIGGDAQLAVATLTEAVRNSRYTHSTDRALEALVEIGQPPDSIRRLLRHFAWSPHRVEDSPVVSGLPHSDERIRAAALRLLSMPAG